MVLRIFVYGTLKRGHANHRGCCKGYVSVAPASVAGRLVELPEGYPMLLVRPADILAHGTADALADTRTQDLLTAGMPQQPPGDRLVLGEILCFDDPVERLAILDRLEGFEHNGPSLYARALLPVCVSGDGGRPVPCWAYVSPGSSLRRDGT